MTNLYKTGRVVIVGVDGGTFDLIRPWIAQGHLPEFARLLAQGASGQLASTIPPITGPAWASFMTGKNPGGHGCGDWMRRREDSYRLRPMTSADIRAKTVWEIAADAGLTVGVLNVPATYPPFKLKNGYMISGWPMPIGATDTVAPPEVAASLRAAVGEYRVYPREAYAPGRARAFVDDLSELTEQTTRAAVYLLEKHPADLFMAHYVATDHISHALWHTLEPDHPAYTPEEAARFGTAILDAYRQVDAGLAALRATLKPEDTLLVVSDHGFGSLRKYLYLNNWLLQKGFLRLRPNALTRVKAALFRLGFTPATLYGWMKRLGVQGMARRVSKQTRYDLLRPLFLSAQDIDWSRTRAYSVGNIGQVYINLQGREPEGAVAPGPDYERTRDEIIAGLLQLHDRTNGRRLISQVYKREAIYSGAEVESLPDLVFLPDDLAYQAAGLTEFTAHTVLGPSFAFTGGHRMNGILLAAGAGVQPGAEIIGAEISDIAPTLLARLGLPIPADMNGRVLTALFRPETLAAEYAAAPEVSREEKVYSDDEQAEIERRLEELGYAT